MGINKSTAKKLEYRRVFWPGYIKSTGTVNRQFRVDVNYIETRPQRKLNDTEPRPLKTQKMQALKKYQKCLKLTYYKVAERINNAKTQDRGTKMLHEETQSYEN